MKTGIQRKTIRKNKSLVQHLRETTNESESEEEYGKFSELSSDSSEDEPIYTIDGENQNHMKETFKNENMVDISNFLSRKLK